MSNVNKAIIQEFVQSGILKCFPAFPFVVLGVSS